MKIKTLNGEVKEARSIYTCAKEQHHPEVWIAWTDIKPILEEYAAAIENDRVGCSDYGLMK